jgi:hypothetical protein
MPGFASTADLIEALARREREPGRRQRLLEAAGFYRSLAEIIPNIPAGYKSNGAPPALSGAERWAARARQCRTLADHSHDPDCRAKLIGLAETCEARAGDELNAANHGGSRRVALPAHDASGRRIDASPNTSS